MSDKSKGIESLTSTFSPFHWLEFIESSLASVRLEIKKPGEDTSTSKEPNSEARVDVSKLSPQQVDEFDDTLASMHDNLSQDNRQTKKAFKMVDEEYVNLGVKNMPTEEENQPTAVGGNPKPIIRDSSSNTSLS